MRIKGKVIKGHGGGQVVSVHAFYSDGSNAAVAYSFSI